MNGNWNNREEGQLSLSIILSIPHTVGYVIGCIPNYGQKILQTDESVESVAVVTVNKTMQMLTIDKGSLRPPIVAEIVSHAYACIVNHESSMH